jgi:hypothetical protein
VKRLLHGDADDPGMMSTARGPWLNGLFHRVRCSAAMSSMHRLPLRRALGGSSATAGVTGLPGDSTAADNSWAQSRVQRRARSQVSRGQVV